MTLFSNMMSGMLQCSCGAQLFYDEDLEAKGVAHTCWNCGKAVQVPNKIIIGKNRVLLNQNTKLLHHHVYDDFDMDTVVGSVVQNPKNPALWGIRNEDKVNWTYQKADGTQIPVAPGKTAGIAKGVKILFVWLPDGEHGAARRFPGQVGVDPNAAALQRAQIGIQGNHWNFSARISKKSAPFVRMVSSKLKLSAWRAGVSPRPRKKNIPGRLR